MAQALAALQQAPEADRAARYDAAVALASLPEGIRGYDHLRSRSMASARSREQELPARWTPAA
ncbi:DUF6537 domain-containing protein [Verminephrobacter eiseniae]|uniref:DUF6537 domain-containing protein n=1 Tax=Verminephrobacter eiseniae TaxID=364317 RepID=UPI002238A7FA|nr:DUF6537 domain-containing protein [Verminephrobacter eiseniae]MCW5238655.1 hypothetical protein [Verminephrobacter eiseniae]